MMLLEAYSLVHMKIVCWNCRGAVSPSFRVALRDILTSNKPDLLVLLETRAQSNRAKWILHHFSNSAMVEARGFSGGIWCFWNQAITQIRVLGFTAQTITLRIAGEHYKNKWLLSLVYASPTASIRELFCDYMEQLSRMITIPWCILGDFNQVIYQKDKQGGRAVRGNAAERMRLMFDRCGLMETKFVGPPFTWTNGQHGKFKIQQRLDQCWSNRQWHLMFPRAVNFHLPRTHSDHHPILIDTAPDMRRNGAKQHFRFQLCWLEHKEFGDFIQQN